MIKDTRYTWSNILVPKITFLLSIKMYDYFSLNAIILTRQVQLVIRTYLKWGRRGRPSE